MFAMRCTRKPLDRIPGVVEEAAPSTTVLGDWYANILFGHPQVVLLVSEKSLLPAVTANPVIFKGCVPVSSSESWMEFAAGLSALIEPLVPATKGRSGK